MEHVVAIRFCFKGVHDGAGKESTHYCHKYEKAGEIWDEDLDPPQMRPFAARSALMMYHECNRGLRAPKKTWKSEKDKPLHGFDNYEWRFLTVTKKESYGDEQAVYDEAVARGHVLVHDKGEELWDASKVPGSKTIHFWRNGFVPGAEINVQDLRGREFACGCTRCRPPHYNYEGCMFKEVTPFRCMSVQQKAIAPTMNDEGVATRARRAGAVEEQATKAYADKVLEERAATFKQRLGQHVAFSAGNDRRYVYHLAQLHDIRQLEETDKRSNGRSEWSIAKGTWVCEISWLVLCDDEDQTYTPGERDLVELDSLVATPERLVLEDVTINVKQGRGRHKKAVPMAALRLNDASHAAIMRMP